MIIEKFLKVLIKSIKSKNIVFLSLLFIPGSLPAQTAQMESGDQTYVLYILVITFLLILFSIGSLFYFGFGKEEEIPVKKEKDVSAWAKIKEHLSGAAPIEKEGEILMEDDYDGIKELDNKVPPWFNYLFYATIIFGIYYMLNYHVFKTGKLQAQEYQEEMQAAATQKAELMKTGALLNEDDVTLLKDPASLSAGKNIFKNNCVPCHGPEAGGVVGPNLTDDYWIHGGGIKNVFKTIKYGVPAKGMITWMNQLNPKQIQEVASYVISLHGTHPANAKPPQGTKYESEDE